MTTGRQSYLRRRLSSVLSLGLAAGAIGFSAVPANAAAGPFQPPYPTVYITQSAGSTTDLKQAAQSRLANGGVGGVTISTVGTASVALNAVGYRVADGYLYGMVNNNLQKIHSDGSATSVGVVAGLPAGSYYSGSFGGGALADTLFVMALSGSTIYGIDVTTRAVTTTLNLSTSIAVADFTWANGYLWGINTSAGAPRLARIAMNGAVTNIATTGIFATGDTGYYGAAWVYGNGNLAYSYNSTGRITQLKVTDPTGVAPTASLVSSIAGPSTSANDGATSPAGDSDLGLTVEQPDAGKPGDPATWSVGVSNAGPGGSSGGTFSFAVPSGLSLTAAGLPTGCSITGAVVQCVTGQLADGAADTYHFSGNLGSTLTVPQSTTVKIIANENDPGSSDNTAQLTFAPAQQTLTTSGTGTSSQQTTVAMPAGASVYLLDDTEKVTTLTVPRQGTYTVTPGTGVIVFTPDGLFTGEAAPVEFVIVPTSGAAATGSYVATVAKPAGPKAAPVATTGVGTEAHHTEALAPKGGSLTLVDDKGEDVTYLSTEAGGYLVDGAHLVFEPHRGFSGTDVVTYEITDAYGQSSSSQYTVTVTPPAVTVVKEQATSAPRGMVHTAHLDLMDATLVDESGDEVGEIAIPGQGTYRIADGDGVVLSFTPEQCFLGVADPVDYRSIDPWKQRSETATYTATVTGVTAAKDLESTGVGTATQSVSVPLACSDEAHLLDDEGDVVTEVTELTRSGEGTYTVDPGTGKITFTPDFGYSGTPAPVPFRVTDELGGTAEAGYTPTVTAPALPTPPAAATTGVGTAVHSTQLVVPTGGSLTLLDGSTATDTLDVDGVGTYVLDPATALVSFVPAPGYTGTAAAVTYEVTDAYGQRATGSYTVTVTMPAPPEAAVRTSSGGVDEPQQQLALLPTGGTATLIDASGQPAGSVTIGGQGTYTLDSETGVLTFVPVAGFTGQASPVTYRVRDAYGQTADGTYQATVVPTALPPVGKPRLKAPDLVRNRSAVATTCSLTTGLSTACTVTAYAKVGGERTRVGAGTTTLRGAAGRTGAAKVAVKVKLTDLGRALAARPGGVRLKLTAGVRPVEGSARYAKDRTRVQAPTVRLRPIYFATDSAVVRPGDRAYLLHVRTLLAGVRSVTCTGFTDARSTVDYNASLAKRRAQAACAVLLGGKPVKSATVSRGEVRPAHPNDTVRGRALNRRGEITLKY